MAESSMLVMSEGWRREALAVFGAFGEATLILPVAPLPRAGQ